MDQLQSPFSPRPTLRTKKFPVGDTPSPPSSITTSAPPSPTTSTRRHNQVTSPDHLFDLVFHPHTAKEDSDSPRHGLSEPANGVSVLPCAVLRGRSSLMVVRRRPSAVEMALSEEQSRCDCDAIERQGLDLMEPRPIERNAAMGFHHAPGAMSSIGAVGAPQRRSCSGARSSVSSDSRAVQQPRFVMGGYL
ncbi:hypothetical protein N7468_002163 [Penicillium chermesinum]|uniref:Uncharacterized protein n=1 Tax=Penicillium chermesinum TaxID=63820 RepID=A0A9W9TXC2_9EURO|nr:uncharacterized protein N7468_002163 [Penicillium chermesinum]KAJ5247180.1 hypothetical protein N7468_002163 [Penicillium chermesinum]